MQNKFTVLISQNYLQRENVEGWLLSYCNRNGIPWVLHLLATNFANKMEYYYEIDFRSNLQIARFQIQGNKQFPYFEFL